MSIRSYKLSFTINGLYMTRNVSVTGDAEVAKEKLKQYYKCADNIKVINELDTNERAEDPRHDIEDINQQDSQEQ